MVYRAAQQGRSYLDTWINATLNHNLKQKQGDGAMCEQLCCTGKKYTSLQCTYNACPQICLPGNAGLVSGKKQLPLLVPRQPLKNYRLLDLFRISRTLLLFTSLQSLLCHWTKDLILMSFTWNPLTQHSGFWNPPLEKKILTQNQPVVKEQNFFTKPQHGNLVKYISKLIECKT